MNIVDVLNDCADSWGGIDKIDSVAPDKILACACCDGKSALSNDYGTCASYVSEEEPSLTSEASAYGLFATLCSQSATCTGSASGSTVRSATASATSASEESSSISGASATNSGSTPTPTPGPSGSSNDDPACGSMYGMFESCIKETEGFADLPYRSQAPCYCCGGSRQTWTDELDDYASTCWDWASASATNTKWDYARTFATFCENFSDICEDRTSTDASSQPTGGVTVTVTQAGGSDQPTDSPDAAVDLRISSAAGFAGLIAAIMML
jgi:hypothetical protein